MQVSQHYQDLFFTILLYMFIICWIIQLFYHWVVFSRLAFYKPRKKKRVFHPVSVIISAKNEYINLKNNLHLVLEQDYPEFEVVVVNDTSDDDTLELLKYYELKYSHLKIVNITQNLNFFRGKKFPLALGIKSAAHELLLMTDADCRPISNQWIRKMAGNFRNDIDIILGYGSYERKKGFLNKLIRYDTFHVAMQYLSLSLMGKTYMGVGRNLAYRKPLFYKNKGFSSHYKVQSGDDDLFINRAANSGNTRIEIDKESHTVSTPASALKEFCNQKKRHISTARYYKNKYKMILGIYSLSQFLFWILFIILISFQIYVLYLLLLFAIKLVSQFIINKNCMNRLDEKNLLLESFFIELILVILNPLLVFSNLVNKQEKWK